MRLLGNTAMCLTWAALIALVIHLTRQESRHAQ